MDYKQLGKFVESLMIDYVKGDLDNNEFVQYTHKKIEELKGSSFNITNESQVLLALYQVHDKSDALNLVNSIVESANVKFEQFFLNSAKSLLTGLILYVKLREQNAGYGDIKRELYEISKNEGYLNSLMKEIGTNHPSYPFFKDVSQHEGKTNQSILSTLSQLLD